MKITRTIYKNARAMLTLMLSKFVPTLACTFSLEKCRNMKFSNSTVN